MAQDTEAQWEEGYTALQAYVAENGDARVPGSHRTVDGYNLGNWVTVQRQFYRKGRLKPERITRLEAVEGWVWNRREAQWNEGYAALRAYVAENGSARVPTSHRTVDGYNLLRDAAVQSIEF